MFSLPMPKTNDKVRVHPLHYVFVLISTIFVFVVTHNVSFLNHGLKSVPFILIPTIVALFGDFGAGVFAVIFTSIAVEIMAPTNMQTINASTLQKMAEYAVITTIVFVLAWRSRKLHANNIVLGGMTDRLQGIVTTLKAEATGNEIQLKKLNDVNKELVSLVNQFIEDDAYWNRKLPSALTHKPHTFRKKQSMKAPSISDIPVHRRTSRVTSS